MNEINVAKKNQSWAEAYEKGRIGECFFGEQMQLNRTAFLYPLTREENQRLHSDIRAFSACEDGYKEVLIDVKADGVIRASENIFLELISDTRFGTAGWGAQSNKTTDFIAVVFDDGKEPIEYVVARLSDLQAYCKAHKTLTDRYKIRTVSAEDKRKQGALIPIRDFVKEGYPLFDTRKTDIGGNLLDFLFSKQPLKPWGVEEVYWLDVLPSDTPNDVFKEEQARQQDEYWNGLFPWTDFFHPLEKD